MEISELLSGRIGLETSASLFLAEHDRSQFDRSRERLTLDMVLFSLVSYLGAEQFDWQLKRTMFRGSTTGAEIYTQRLSKAKECTMISSEELRTKLDTVGNLFAKARVTVVGGKLCLPTASTITITDTALEISTPFCSIAFTLEPSKSVSYTKPGSGGEVPKLDNGEAQLETRLTGVRAVVSFSWIRAQHQQMKIYEEWSDRLVRGARVWFEGRV